MTLDDLTKAVGQGVPGSPEHQMLVAEFQRRKIAADLEVAKAQAHTAAAAMRNVAQIRRWFRLFTFIMFGSFVLSLLTYLRIEPPEFVRDQLGIANWFHAGR
jgi:hypothetical protein